MVEKKTGTVHARALKISEMGVPHEDLVAYLDTQKASRDRSLCKSCAMGTAVEEACLLYIASVKRDREAGRIPKSIKGFWRVLVKHYNYPLQRDALTEHLRRCLGAGPS